MDRTLFRDARAGRIVRTPQGYDAFVPAALPPELTYTADLVMLLSRADAALSELSGLGRHLPNPHLLIAPHIRREAVLSSKIEGTHTNIADLLRGELEEQESAADRDPDRQEVRNYVVALEYGIERLHTLPLSLRLVRELHARLMAGVRGEHATPGAFRVSQNWIGIRGSTLANAAYVPPPVEQMMDLLGDWERFIHRKDVMPDLVQCAVMHEQFEAIHPFLDGNGRIGRLLITLFLLDRGRLSQPLLYLSAFFEANRDQYYDLLQRVRTHADWQSWLTFFLAGVRETSVQSVAHARALIDLNERIRGQLHELPSGTTVAQRLAERLFINPYVTVRRITHDLGVSAPTARKAIAQLQAIGVLSEMSGREWNRVFVAAPILHAIQTPPALADDQWGLPGVAASHFPLNFA